MDITKDMKKQGRGVAPWNSKNETLHFFLPIPMVGMMKEYASEIFLRKKILLDKCSWVESGVII